MHVGDRHCRIMARKWPSCENTVRKPCARDGCIGMPPRPGINMSQRDIESLAHVARVTSYIPLNISLARAYTLEAVAVECPACWSMRRSLGTAPQASSLSRPQSMCRLLKAMRTCLMFRLLSTGNPHLPAQTFSTSVIELAGTGRQLLSVKVKCLPRTSASMPCRARCPG